MPLARALAICLSAVVLTAAGLTWWQKQYPDAPALACAIYDQRLRFEHAQKHHDKQELRSLQTEFVALLSNKQSIFRDTDGTEITVRDAAADVLDELGDSAYWVTTEKRAVKLVACCPLPQENDCARIHVTSYTDQDFAKLRQRLAQ